MTIAVPSRLRSYLRRKLEKTRGCSVHPSINTDHVERRGLAATTTPRTTKSEVSTPKPTFDEQQDSPFFHRLPFEIRKMIYAYVWQGPYDHMYHEPNGRHLHFKDGHWVHTRCVMYEEEDEDLDMIQQQMDVIRHSGVGDLLLWQRRLASTWGQRHWRCAERNEYGKPTSIDRTDLGALTVVCKKMHPEVMESFIECHKMIFNDIFSAHRFLVPSNSTHLIRHLRRLDLTLSVPFHELAPFITIGHPETDHDCSHDHSTAATERTTLPADAVNSRLGSIFAALASHPTCLHSLQVSLDVYDRGPWRKIPECALASHLERIPVRRGKQGEVNYSVELPAALPIRTHYAGLQDLEDGAGDGHDHDHDHDHDYDRDRDRDHDSDERVTMPFHITRRPPLRYWQFSPGQVEHFTWKTHHSDGRRQHCWITPSKATTRPISNPYLIDFTER